MLGSEQLVVCSRQFLKTADCLLLTSSGLFRPKVILKAPKGFVLCKIAPFSIFCNSMAKEKYTHDFVAFLIALKEDKVLGLKWKEIANLFTLDGLPLDERSLRTTANNHRIGGKRYKNW